MRKNTFDKLKSTMAILLSGALILPMQTAPAIASSIPQEPVPNVGSLEDGNTSTDDRENPTITADDNPLRLGTDFMMPFGERASESGLKVDIGWVDSGISGWEKSEDGFHLSWSSDKTETRTAEMNVYYEDRDCSAGYKAGDIKIRVPMLSQLDDAQISADSGLANFKHIFRWQPVQIEGVDYVELTNNNDIAAGTNFSGFVNIIWEFNNRYVGPCRKDVEVSGEVKNGESGEMSALECGTSLGIRIDTVKDAFSPKLSASKISAIDDMPSNWRDYIWVNYTFNPHQSMKSMGLTRASYSFEVPDNCLVYNNALGDREASSQQYRVEVKSADKPENQMFAIGWPKSEYEGKSATITGIMNGTYRNGDALDSSISQHVFTIPNLSAADYDFAYSGNKFGISKNFEEAETNTNVLQGVGSSTGLASQVSAIGKAFPDETYTYEIYDDFQDITTNKNGYRALQPSETGYDVVYAPEKILDSSGKPRPDSNDMIGKVYTVDGNGIDTYVGELKGISIGHNNFIDIPESSYGVKIVYENVSGYVQFSDILVGTRYFVPENRFDWGSTSSNPGISPVNGRVRNVAGLMVRDNTGNLVNEPSRSSYTGEQADYTASRDENRYGHYVQRAYAEIPYHEYRDAKVTFYQELTTRASDSDAKGGTEYFEHSLRTSWTAHGQWDGDNTDIPHYDELVVGVLLPRGWESVGQTGLIRPSIANGRPVYRTVIDNYNKTGRTMVVYKVDASQKNYESWPEYNDSFTVYTPVRIPVDLWFEYGNRYTFDSYSLVHEASDTMSEVPNPDGGSGRDALDLDGDGLTSDILAHSATTFSMNTAMGAHLELRERVASENTGGVWKDSTQILLGKEYKYKLSFRTAASETTDIVFYDTLEDGSDWKGRLIGIDVSALESTGYHPVVYLSSDSSAPNNIKSSRWKKQEDFLTEHTYSDVVRIAVALEGDLVPANSHVKAELLMLSSEDDGDIGGKARDSFTVAYKDVDRVSRSIDSSSVEVLLADGFGKIRIDKTDASTGAPIAGAKFDVVNGNGTKILANVSTGTYDMPTGTYSVIETSPPMGYNLDSSPHEVEISADTVAIVEIANARNTGTLQVVKTDASNGMPMEGIEFELKNAEGNVIGTQTTNEQGKASFFGLEWGNYNVHEKNVPDGYKAMPDKFVSINSSNAKGIVPVVIEAKNERQTGTLNIVKKDSYTGDFLEGAKFSLNDGTNIVELTTDDNGAIDYDGIVWGLEYTLTESAAPQGYTKNATPYTFTVDKSNITTPVSLEIENEPIMGSIRIVKEDRYDGKALPDAKFRVLKDGKVFIPEIATNAFGEFTLNDLPWGNYSFVETVPPIGYAMDPRPKNVTITSANCNSEQTLRIANDSIIGDLLIVKYDENKQSEGSMYNGYQLLGGAVLEIYDAAGKLERTVTTSSTTPVTVKDLPYGHYQIKESEMPDGYSSDNNGITEFDFTKSNNICYIANTARTANIIATKNLDYVGFKLYKAIAFNQAGSEDEMKKEDAKYQLREQMNSYNECSIVDESTHSAISYGLASGNLAMIGYTGSDSVNLLSVQPSSDTRIIYAYAPGTKSENWEYEYDPTGSLIYADYVSYGGINNFKIRAYRYDDWQNETTGDKSILIKQWGYDESSGEERPVSANFVLTDAVSQCENIRISNKDFDASKTYILPILPTATGNIFSGLSPYYDSVDSLANEEIVKETLKSNFDSRYYSWSNQSGKWVALKDTNLSVRSIYDSAANGKYPIMNDSVGVYSNLSLPFGEYVLIEPEYNHDYNLGSPNAYKVVNPWSDNGGLQGPYVLGMEKRGITSDLFIAGGPSDEKNAHANNTEYMPIMAVPISVTNKELDSGKIDLGHLVNSTFNREGEPDITFNIRKIGKTDTEQVNLDPSSAAWSYRTRGKNSEYANIQYGEIKTNIDTSVTLHPVDLYECNGIEIFETVAPDGWDLNINPITNEPSALVEIVTKYQNKENTFEPSDMSVDMFPIDSFGFKVTHNDGTEQYYEMKHFNTPKYFRDGLPHYQSVLKDYSLWPSSDIQRDVNFYDQQLPTDYKVVKIAKIDSDTLEAIDGAEFETYLVETNSAGKVLYNNEMSFSRDYPDHLSTTGGKVDNFDNEALTHALHSGKITASTENTIVSLDVVEHKCPEGYEIERIAEHSANPNTVAKIILIDNINTGMSESARAKLYEDNKWIALQDVTDVIVKNKKVSSKGTFTKIDETTGAPISGARFALMKKSELGWENVGTFKTDTRGVLDFQVNTPGEYRLVEQDMENYQEAEDIEFSVLDEAIGEPITEMTNVENGIFYNQRLTSSLCITKTSNDGYRLPGAVFELRDMSGRLINNNIETDNNGIAIVTGLPVTIGEEHYTLKEIQAPLGYSSANTDFSVQIEPDKITSIEIENTRVFDDKHLRIIKVDSAEKLPLPNAVFEIWDKTEDTLFKTNLTTDIDGIVDVWLAKGEYRIIEKTPPKGYASANPFEINLQQDTEITIEDEALPNSISVKKIDASSGSFLQGASFKLYESQLENKHDYYHSFAEKYSESIPAGGRSWADYTNASYNFMYRTDQTGYATREYLIDAPCAGTISSKAVVIGNTWQSSPTYSGSYTIYTRSVGPMGYISLMKMNDDGTWSVAHADAPLHSDSSASSSNTFSSSYLQNYTFNVDSGKYKVVYKTRASRTPGTVASGYTRTTYDSFNSFFATIPTFTSNTQIDYQEWSEYNEIDEKVTDTSGKLAFSNINGQSRYRIAESAAPYGYKLIEGMIDVPLDRINVQPEIVVENEPYLGSVILTKTFDEETAPSLSQAVSFDLYNADTQEKLQSELKLNDDSKLNIVNLHYGNYFLRETSTAPGYILANDLHFTIDSENELELSLNNRSLSTNIRVHKMCDDTSDPVVGAEFALKRTDVDPHIIVQNGTTDENGNLVFENVPITHTYELEETKIPEGFIAKNTITNVPQLTQEDLDITVLNYIPNTDIKITKIDSETNEPLQGATFELRRKISPEIIGYEKAYKVQSGPTWSTSNLSSSGGVNSTRLYTKNSSPISVPGAEYLDVNVKYGTYNSWSYGAIGKGSQTNVSASSLNNTISSRLYTSHSSSSTYRNFSTVTYRVTGDTVSPAFYAYSSSPYYYGYGMYVSLTGYIPYDDTTKPIYSPDYEVVATAITDENGVCEFKNMNQFYDYYVMETNPPEGYASKQDKYDITLDENHFAELSIENDFLGDVNVIKTDKEDGTALSGARFGLYKVLKSNLYHKTYSTSTNYSGSTNSSYDWSNIVSNGKTYYRSSSYVQSLSTSRRNVTFTIPEGETGIVSFDAGANIDESVVKASDYSAWFSLTNTSTNQRLVYRNMFDTVPEFYDSASRAIQKTGALYSYELPSGAYTLTFNWQCGTGTSNSARANSFLWYGNLEVISATGSESGTPNLSEPRYILMQNKLTGADGTIRFIPDSTDYEYVVMEMRAPAGYDIDRTIHPVIFNTQKHAYVSAENERATGYLNAAKYSNSARTQTLSGAVFNLYDDAGNLIASGITSNSSGILEPAIELPFGTYYLEETQAPQGYKLPKTRTEYIVNSVNTNLKSIYNARVDGTATVHKTDAEGNPLAGAEFTVEARLRDSSRDPLLWVTIGTGVTDETGTAEITGINRDHITHSSYFYGYRIYETKPPAGYASDGVSSAQSVAFDELTGKATQELTFTNEPAPMGIEIHKVDSRSNDIPVQGAKFEIHNAETKELIAESDYTDSDGIASVFGLPWGDYYLVETETGSYYTVDPTPKPFTLGPDTATVFKDSKWYTTMYVPNRTLLPSWEEPPRHLYITKNIGDSSILDIAPNTFIFKVTGTDGTALYETISFDGSSETSKTVDVGLDSDVRYTVEEVKSLRWNTSQVSSTTAIIEGDKAIVPEDMEESTVVFENEVSDYHGYTGDDSKVNHVGNQQKATLVNLTARTVGSLNSLDNLPHFVVKAYYSDGTSKDVSSEAGIEYAENIRYGDYTMPVNISYGGLEITLKLHASIAPKPYKVEYYYDGVIDDSKTKSISLAAKKVGTEITYDASKDVAPLTYSLDRIDNQTFIVSDDPSSAQQVVKLFYVSDGHYTDEAIEGQSTFFNKPVSMVPSKNFSYFETPVNTVENDTTWSYYADSEYYKHYQWNTVPTLRLLFGVSETRAFSMEGYYGSYSNASEPGTMKLYKWDGEKYVEVEGITPSKSGSSTLSAIVEPGYYLVEVSTARANGYGEYWNLPKLEEPAYIDIETSIDGERASEYDKQHVAIFPNTEYSYANIQYDGQPSEDMFKCTSCEPETLNLVPGESVAVKLGYSTKTSYTVNYYFNNELDRSETQTVSGLYNDTVSVTPKTFAQCTFTSMDRDSIVLTKDPAENVINLHYDWDVTASTLYGLVSHDSEMNYELTLQHLRKAPPTASILPDGTLLDAVYVAGSYTSESAVPWRSSYSTRIKKVSIPRTIVVPSLQYYFAYMTSLVELDLTNLDFSRLTNLTRAFYQCSKLKTIYASEGTDWGATHSTGSYVFSGCSSLVGGNGTKYKSTSSYDYSYACIDNLNGKLGYFTAGNKTCNIEIYKDGVLSETQQQVASAIPGTSLNITIPDIPNYVLVDTSPSSLKYSDGLEKITLSYASEDKYNTTVPVSIEFYQDGSKHREESMSLPYGSIFTYSVTGQEIPNCKLISPTRQTIIVSDSSDVIRYEYSTTYKYTVNYYIDGILSAENVYESDNIYTIGDTATYIAPFAYKNSVLEDQSKTSFECVIGKNDNVINCYYVSWDPTQFFGDAPQIGSTVPTANVATEAAVHVGNGTNPFYYNTSVANESYYQYRRKDTTIASDGTSKLNFRVNTTSKYKFYFKYYLKSANTVLKASLYRWDGNYWEFYNTTAVSTPTVGSISTTSLEIPDAGYWCVSFEENSTANEYAVIYPKSFQIKL